MVIKDIPYGNHERHRVDIFIPEKVRKDSGIIFYIHGGGWTSADKSVHHPDCEHFASLGYISTTMNYRYVDEKTVVADELDDITSALETVKNALSENGYKAEKVILAGGSAGAHLALMYAYTRFSESPVLPVAVCAYCPPVNMERPDFLLGISGEFEEWKYGVLSACCGVKICRETLLCDEQQTALKKISPLQYVTENCVPTAIFHGRNDELVPFEHAVEFVNLLSEKGVENDFLIFENSGHAQDKDPEKVIESKEIIKNYAEKYF